jgi:hypothetical protein
MKTIKGVNESGDKIKQVFNVRGQLVEEQIYMKMFGPFSTKFTEKYSYDADGSRIETTCWEKGRLLWTKKHYYNSEGQLIRDVQVDDSGEGFVEYEYNDNGHRIAEQGKLAGGHQYRNEWKVDADGRRARGSDIHYDG